MLFYLLFIAAFIALLLFVSSRIRNAANAAYEPERIERDDFRISKPEGYLTPVEWTEKRPFEAYTRELGERSMGRLRKSLANLTVTDGLAFDNLRREIKKNAPEFVSVRFDDDAPEGERVCLIETKKEENEITTVFLNKLVENRRRKKTYNLEVSVLEEYRDEYENRIAELLNSFEVK